MTYGTNAAFGLKPIGYIGGKEYTGKTRKYNIASGYATNIGENDPVAALSDGTIGIGVAGSQCRGVLRGIEYTDTNGVRQYKNNWVASTTVKTGTVVIAYVADEPGLVFDVQETNGAGVAGTPIVLADRNANINFVIGAPGTMGNSTTSLNNTTTNTTSTLNLRILDLSDYPGNVVGNFANWLVVWNTHDLKSVGTAGV